jgi:hypothetical protein
MARRGKKKKGRRSNKMTIPIAMVAPVALPVVEGMTKMASGDIKGGAQFIATKFTGLQADGTFNSAYLVNTYTPILAGIIVHKAASKFGLNAALGRAKIPLLRV